jgi:hypothetical protein
MHDMRVRFIRILAGCYGTTLATQAINRGMSLEAIAALEHLA